MFRSLTDFSRPRSPLEALGFYLFYLLVSLLAGALIGGLAALLSPGQSFEAGTRAGALLAVLLSLALSSLLLSQRGLLAHPGYLVIALVSAVAALFGGGLLGLIGPAFLSTREPGPAG
jgi:hypothetical protein